MLKKLCHKLLEQKSLPWIGALKDLWAMTSVYISAINFVLITITAYGTTIGPMLRTPGAGWLYLPWMRLQWFILALIIIVLTAMYLEYILVYKSYFTFRNKQEYDHNNLIRADIAALKDQQAAEAKMIDERLTRIERALSIPEKPGPAPRSEESG